MASDRQTRAYTALSAHPSLAPRCRCFSTSAPTTTSGWPIRFMSAGGMSGVRGEEYDVFVEEFITATTIVWPHDPSAMGGLRQVECERGCSTAYRDRLATFNDGHPGHCGRRDRDAVRAIMWYPVTALAPLTEQRIAIFVAGLRRLRHRRSADGGR